MVNYYVSSVGYTAVAQFAALTSYAVGNIVRQLAAPNLTEERCFRCTTLGISGASESVWNITQNATTTQGTAVFTECTGQETYQGTSWAAPFARLIPAVSSGFSVAGDTIFVGSDHAETQSSPAMALSTQGTLASPCRVICVAKPSSAIPPVTGDLATTATVSTTSVRNINFSGSGASCTYWYGIAFSAGDSTNTASVTFAGGTSGFDTFEKCTLTLGNTSVSSVFQLGTNNGTMLRRVTLLNSNLKFGSTSQSIQMGGLVKLDWRGGAISALAPTSLFGAYAGPNCNFGIITIAGVDLSLVGSAKTLVTQPGSGNLSGMVGWDFTNCKLSASLGGVTTGTQDFPGHGDIDIVVSDAATTPREEHYRYTGSVIADTANYLTAGASDGVAHKSWKLASNASASYLKPLYAPDIFQWVDNIGSRTFTLYTSNISTLTLKDNEFGFDIEYMGSSSTPLATMSTSFSGPLAAGANLATDTQPWTGQGGLTKQKASAVFTVNQKGWVRIRPRLSRASATIWVDPLVVVL